MLTGLVRKPAQPTDAALDLRPARYDDPDAIALTAQAQAFYRDLYGGEDTNPMNAEEFSPPSGGFLVGHTYDRAVAMGGWRTHCGESPVPGTHPAELRRMFVVAEFRGRGYAGILLAALEDSARGSGADLMILEAGAPQTAALAFYAGRGYRPIPGFGHWVGHSGSVHLGRRL